MFRRRFERVAVMILSIAMLLSSTGIVSSLAAQASVTSATEKTTSSESFTSATENITQAGGDVTTTKVQQEGGTLTKAENGDGTVSNPYKISNADDFIAMQGKINLTSSADKHFILTNDINLSAVSSNKFTGNSTYPGALVTVSKSLSKSNQNVYFVLDGNGHSITGLNVAVSGSTDIALFGYLNAKSQISNLTVKAPKVVSKCNEPINASVLVCENYGTITNVTVSSPVINVKSSAHSGVIVAINGGTIIKSTVKSGQTNVSASTADQYTVTGTGIFGAVAGLNTGRIINASASNIGMFIPSQDKSNTIYGGITGENSATVSNCYSSGNVSGGKSSDVAGGIVGKAVSDKNQQSVLNNNYTLVSISDSVWGCAVIGAGGTKDMVTDCYWSSSISHRHTMVTDYGTGINDISGKTFVVLPVGSTAKLSQSSINNKWGKASFEISGEFTTKAGGISLKSSASVATINAKTADTVNKVIYVAKIKLPSNVGAEGSFTISQYMNIPVAVVPKQTKGDGSQKEPLSINNATEFEMLADIPYINCKLEKDITVSVKPFSYCGEFDGNGHSVNASTQIFSSLFGTVKNTKFVLQSSLSTALLGRAVSANASCVSVTALPGACLNADSDNTGLLFNVIAGESVIDSCTVSTDVVVATKTNKNIGAFAGIVIGDNTVITNSGAKANILTKSDEQSTAVANFIGVIGAENVTLTNDFVSGTNNASNFLFVSEINAEKITVRDIKFSKDTSAKIDKTPIDFNAYKKIVDKAQFKEWSFGDEIGFFTGNGGDFSATLPNVRIFDSASDGEFTVNADTAKVSTYVSVNDGKLVLHVNRADGVVTVKNSIITVTSKTTGLHAAITVSNGLERDADGNYIISTGYDFAYVSENITAYKNSSFVINTDIDMSVMTNFVPIGGTVDSFSGKLNGKGHTISGMTINSTAMVGLFGSLSGADIKNIVFESANVTSIGGYAAILAGQATDNTLITNITVNNSKVNSADIYSALVVGSVNNASGNAQIKDITIKNSSVNTTANYAGGLAGRISGTAVIENISVEGLTIDGAAYVSGIVAQADSTGKVSVTNASVINSGFSGISDIGGTVACGSQMVALNGVTVKNTKISTIGTSSQFVAGGIAASFGGSIDDATVDGCTICAGTSGGIVGKSISNGNLEVKNTKVISTKISAGGANTIAAGIIASHYTNSTVSVTDCTVSSDTVISSAAITSGMVGDCFGEGSKLNINRCSSFATVNGCEDDNVISAAGVLGRIGTSTVNSVSISDTQVAGIINGSGAVGGMIALIKNGAEYNGKAPLISNCVAASRISASDVNYTETTGMIIGCVESKNVLTDKNISSAVDGIVISTYFGSIGAYGRQTGLTGGLYYDMDKPDSEPIKASVNSLDNTSDTTVKISNLPDLEGFTFDSKTGWVSESEERIHVVSSTMDSVVLKAYHKADVSIVAYYVLDSDTAIRVPVHFRMISTIRTPLNGEGTKASPYKISNAYELEAVSEYANDSAYFVLVNDIAFTDKDFEFGGAFYNVGNGIVTIGNASLAFNGNFSGEYEGKIHSITGLKLTGNTFGGLFGATNNAVICNIIINNANVRGLNYAGVVVGSAKNTTLSNITINNADVCTSLSCSLAGSVAGYAENTTISDVKINNSKISTTLNGTAATVEAAGGVAGGFSGTVNDVIISNVDVTAGTVAGGVIAKSTGAKAIIAINCVDAVVTVSADTAGGIIGVIENPLGVTISTASVCGKITGGNIAGGIIAGITGNSSEYSVEKSVNPLLNDVVMTASVHGENTCGVIIGSANSKVFTSKDNEKTQVFKNVYYSSYMCGTQVFGNSSINAYQNSEYKVIDLNRMLYSTGQYERLSLPLSRDYLTLADNSIRLSNTQGNFKEFTAAGKEFKLENISSTTDGLITYNAESCAIKLNSVAGTKDRVVFSYNNGLKTSMSIAQATSLEGEGTQDNPYKIYSSDDFMTMVQNSEVEDICYSLQNDINLEGYSGVEKFASNLDGNGKVIYNFSGKTFFGIVTGRIKNLGIAGFNITNNLDSTVGALANVLDGAKIENCFVIANVSANGTNQDTGILAGRMTNGAKVSGCLTSGKVVCNNSLSVGGIIGSMNNSQLINCTSTAYVRGSRAAGGIVGDSQYSEVNTVIFANMVESSINNSGNIVGVNTNDTSNIDKAYFDSQTSRIQNAAFSGDVTACGKLTSELCSMSLDGFKSVGGYPISASLVKTDSSEKFVTGIEFASMQVKYLAGLNAGTVYNYTDIKADANVNGNSVILGTTDGLTLTLSQDKDYTDSSNIISRYANPSVTAAISVSYTISDNTKNASLSDKLIGILLKSKVGEKSDTFDLFTTANAPIKTIDKVSVSDGKIYVNLALPQSCKFKVSAVDENGNNLDVTDKANEGYLINTANSKSVSLSISIETDKGNNWGLHSLWSVIGK